MRQLIKAFYDYFTYKKPSSFIVYLETQTHFKKLREMRKLEEMRKIKETMKFMEFTYALSDYFTQKRYSSFITLTYPPEIYPKTVLEIRIHLKKFLDEL